MQTCNHKLLKQTSYHKLSRWKLSNLTNEHTVRNSDEEKNIIFGNMSIAFIQFLLQVLCYICRLRKIDVLLKESELCMALHSSKSNRNHFLKCKEHNCSLLRALLSSNTCEMRWDIVLVYFMLNFCIVPWIRFWFDIMRVYAKSAALSISAIGKSTVTLNTMQSWIARCIVLHRTWVGHSKNTTQQN